MNYKSVFVSAILLMSILAFIAPAIPAFASTGTAGLGVVNKPYLNQVTSFTAASANITVKGGSSTVTKVDGAATSGYLVYDFNSVTFSGSQFYLYISKDGLSQISSGDFRFAGPFNVADLSGSPKNVTGGYSIGTYSGQKLVEGPIPTNLSQGNYYIKVYDGSSTSVAVSAPFIQIVPNLVLSPTSGPAGATVTATGYGFTANGVVNISFSPKVDTSVKVNASATGGFAYSFAAGYLGSASAPMIYHTTTTQSPAAFLTLTVTANDTASKLTSSATYNEYYRDFHYIQSFNPSGVAQPVTQGPGGNAPPPYSNASSVNGYVKQNFDIAGDYWNPTQNLTYAFDGSPITPFASSGSANQTGYFWANFTLPVASKGNHHFTVFDANANMSIVINIQTTFLVSPTKGIEGSSVTAQGYGFTNNATVTVWWFGTKLSSSTVNPATDNILLYNATTGSTGSFSFTFTVPNNVYGGNHTVFANDSALTWAAANFEVDPSFALSASSAPQGTTVNLNIFGLWTDQLSGTYSTTDANFSHVNGDVTGVSSYSAKTWWQVEYDNALVEPPYVSLEGNATGFTTFPIVAAGFPGVHYVSAVGVTFYNSLTLGSQYSSAVLPLNVTGSTTEGAAIESMLQTIIGNQANEMSSLNNILSKVNSNGNAISNLSTQVSGVSSQLTTVGNNVNSLSSSVSSGFSSTQSSLGGITSTLSTIQGQTSQIPTVSGNLGSVSTYLLVAIVLAAIVLILEIIILVRKK